MNIFRGKQFHDLAENVVDESVDFVIAGAEHIFAHAETRPYFVGAACAAEFWV